MSVITAPVRSAPISNAGNGSNHQTIIAPSPNFTPSHYSPFPVGQMLKGGVTGIAYSESVTAQGGSSPYTFAITSGTLPTGLSLSSGGAITGTPTVTGTAAFTVTVTDALGYSGSQTFSITIAAPSGGGGGAFTFIQ